MKLKKGDRVMVLSGKDRGKDGVIMKVLPGADKVIVEGVNVAKKHQKATRATMQGGIIDKDMPMPASCGRASSARPTASRPASPTASTTRATRCASAPVRRSICNDDHRHLAAPEGEVRERDPGPAQGDARVSATSWKCRASRRS